jgi:hypothetical protein
MFVKATYPVKVGETDFPKVGDIGITEVDGKDCTIIIKEIISLDWDKDYSDPTLLVTVVAEIDPKDLGIVEKPKKHKTPGNKFSLIEGGKG